jgi:tRNA threonylcarbamoyl adenosine modification protein YeaZ
MDLVIDTSSARAGLAVLDGRRVIAEDVRDSGRDLDFGAWVRELVDPRAVDRVLVALGPGSFTGLRTGASFGLGLALGRRLPLLGFGSLELQQARARTGAVTGLAEAGRGRVYYRTPAGEEGIAEAAEVPAGGAGAGWLRPATAAALAIPLLPDERLRSFGEAAAEVSGRAAELGYDRVGLRYVQSFGPVD